MSLKLLVNNLQSKFLARNTLHILNRFASTFNYRESCADVKEPICSEENLAQRDPCFEKEVRLAKGLPPPESNSMWLNPECCKESCPILPRYDEMYYKPSDKLKRKYQQTWVACPDLHIEEVTVCCNESLNFAPKEKRVFKRVEKGAPATSCSKVSPSAKVCKPPPIQKKGCPYVPLPDCSGRKPPTCPKRRISDGCAREKTPYPSFSECQKDEIDPSSPVECRCLDPVFMCEVWAEYRRRLKLD